MAVKLKKEDCVGCGACEDVCPNGAIKVDEIAVISDKDCVDCGVCVDECPNKALTL